ncbi:B9 domain-containing protein 2 [Globomyces pollinis-pini]|nr:B9 domain-containing protein 2 [Globomyces pollinis-pini]
MAEIHILGSLVGASDFPKSQLCCKWSIVSGESWVLLEGETSGRTHVDIPLDPTLSVWSHPLDIHFATKSIAGWPKLVVHVFHQDMFGRNELFGYGFIHVPATPGKHTMEIVTWRPTGTMKEQLWATFLGATNQLKDTNLIYDPMDRFRLVTESMGKVHVEFDIIIRNFQKTGVSS